MEGQEVILSTCNNKILKKKILAQGDFSTYPVEGANCQLEITNINFKNRDGVCGKDENSFFLSESFPRQCTIGKATYYLDIDIERCVTHMNLNEISEINMLYLNRENETALDVTYNVQIVSVKNTKLFCDWEWSKKVIIANKHKETGIALVKENKLLDAFKQFSKALKFILTIGGEDFDNMTEEDKEKLNSDKLKLYNNLAHCQLQYNEFAAVIILCNKALEIENENVKALYRRASAYMGLENWESAHADMLHVLTIDPSISEAKVKMVILREKVKDMNDAYKKTIKSMFA